MCCHKTVHSTEPMLLALSQNRPLYSAGSSHNVVSMYAPIKKMHTFGAVTKPLTLLRLDPP